MAEKKSVLTLNLGSQRVSMARFGIGGKGALLLKDYQIREMAGDPTSDGARRVALSSAVKELTGYFKAANGGVSYAVPGQFLIAKFVKLPPLAEDQVDKIVGFEAAQAVPFPLTETSWDYQLMGQNTGDVEVGIVAIRTEHLTELHSSVENAQLDTQLVDGAPLALYNAFRYNYPDAVGCALLIDLGARTTNLLFIEGHKLFISSFQTGGAAVTQSIAKEMGMDYDTAEGRKVKDGFVHLGGNYADHEDPEVDAMSKVIRNALLKVHGEITRRTNAYRSQQGGSAPTAVYLAGAGASLPYLKEVFEEKLRVPVEYFNPLRNVQVGPRVNADQVGAEAHTLGEVVGLALREMACPMELDLSPSSVKAAKDVGSRKPRLLLAAACLAAGLGALIMQNKGASSKFANETRTLQNDVDRLSRYDQQIKAQETRQKTEEARAEIISNAVADRSYWVRFLNLLNAELSDEKMWITMISPVNSFNEEVTQPMSFGTAMAYPFLEGAKGAPPPSGKGPQKSTVNVLYVSGINRGDSGDVSKYLLRLRDKMGEYLEFDPAQTEDALITDYILNNAGDAAAKDGYAFYLKLPLKRKFEVTKQAPVTTGRAN